MSLGILHPISNPDCLVAPVMDFLFIIIAVTASNLTGRKLNVNPVCFYCEEDVKVEENFLMHVSWELALMGSANTPADIWLNKSFNHPQSLQGRLRGKEKEGGKNL